MLAEPIRWSHASGNRVVPSPWQMTRCVSREMMTDRSASGTVIDMRNQKVANPKVPTPGDIKPKLPPLPLVWLTFLGVDLGLCGTSGVGY